MRYRKKVTYQIWKAEYLYICVPFLILILVKIYFGPLRDIIYTSDWSLAASIILGQNAAKSHALFHRSNKKSMIVTLVGIAPKDLFL